MTRPTGPAVMTFHLLSLGRLHVEPGEIQHVLLHRHMLSLYLAILFLLVGLDTNGASGTLSIDIRGAIYAGAMLSFMLVVSLGFGMARRLALRRGRFNMHLSPMLFLGTVVSVVVGETLLHLMMEPDHDTPARLVLLLTFHYLVAEMATAIVAHTLLPGIIGEIRGLPIRKLSQTDPALWAPTAQRPANPPPLTGFLVAAGRSYPLATLLHLQADGNYVHLWATDRHELLPGPLTDLVRQLPDGMGRQVHRSHWVAIPALAAWQSAGREITLHLTNGQQVPVAVTRRRELRNWLTDLGLERRDLA